MTILEAYNLCLRAIGQSAIASISLADPDVAEIQNVFNAAKREILQPGYPFNTDLVELLPNEDSKIDVSGYLQIKGLTEKGYTIRSGFVWDPANSEYLSTTLGKMSCVIDSNWDDIPDEFKRYIATRAAVSFLMQVKGPTADFSYWNYELQAAASRAEMLYPPSVNSSTVNRLKANYFV